MKIEGFGSLFDRAKNSIGLIYPGASGRPEIDQEEFQEHQRDLWQQVERYFERVRQAINSNDGSSLIVQEGGKLPAASREYLGILVTKQAAGSDDELYWCQRKADGTFAWTKIA